MGVRFPAQADRPDFGPMQNDPLQQSNPLQGQADSSAIEASIQTAEESAVAETQEAQAVTQQAPAEQAPAEQAADDAGGQTPGSMFDMLA
jgi:hypothetical protein